ncbi:SH3 domain-containing protein [Streptomyces sp. NPDC051546]|uniref:SH3 domain-containing protein n=1 Tax=Streptomyces sp. NPDC051546 TaxID=3365655 RepID=UPI00379DACD7
MPVIRRLTTVALSATLLAGGALAIAPSASAADRDCTSYDQSAGVDGSGINYRTGPSTAYKSKGMLYKKDSLNIYCEKNGWYYTKLRTKSASGLKAGTAGWIRKDMVKLWLAG